MAKGPLRRSLENLARTMGSEEGEVGWWEKVKARSKLVFELARGAFLKNPVIASANLYLIVSGGFAYIVSGDETAIYDLKRLSSDTPLVDTSAMVADVMRKVFSQPEAREIAETLGAFVTEPVVSIFEQYAEDGKRDEVDPLEFARAFHGFMIGLTVSGGLADTVLETATGGQVEGAGRMLNSMYWSLGLGFLGWQTLAPLLSSGLQPGLQRHYQRLYRPERFNAADLRDLFALGKISAEELKREAEFLGWRDKDIPQWLELAYRTLPQGDIWQAFNEGFITQDEAIRRLRVLGFNPKDIPLLFKLNPPKVVDDTKNFSISTASQAFRQHLMGESEFRKILADLDMQPREIDLRVALEKQKIAGDEKELSQGQIKSAWEQNVITDAEARHWLDVAGFAPDKINIILETWRAENVPVFVKLNIGTITAAYVEGILDRNQASRKLKDVGLAPEDATLELDLAEARNPDAFGRAEPPPPKLLTPGLLSDLVGLGLITAGQMSARLVEIGYPQADANLLAEAARLRATPPERLLGQNTIERSYIAEVITREQAAGALVELGFTAERASTILDTVDAEKVEEPEVVIEERIRELGPARLEDLLIGGLITPQEMFDRLVLIDFSEVDAELLVNRALQLAQPPRRTLTRSDVENAYLVGVLDRTQAKQRLIGMDFDEDDSELILVTLEQANPQVFNPVLVQAVRVPSIGALVAAVQRTIISEEEYFARAMEIGYSPGDALLYLSISTKQERKGTVTLSASQVGQAYDAGFLSWGQALSRLYQHGYNDTDAILLLRLRKDVIFNTEEWVSLLGGQIGAFDAITAFINAKYSDQDILDAFGTLSPSALAELGIDLQGLAALLSEIPGGE